MSTASHRPSYVVGLPVEIIVGPDGAVEVIPHLEEATSALADEGHSAERIALVDAAYDAGMIHVRSPLRREQAWTLVADPDDPAAPAAVLTADEVRALLEAHRRGLLVAAIDVALEGLDDDEAGA